MTDNRTLLIGLGSPHGDDRVGLCIAEQLTMWRIPGIQVHLARSPGEILDWLNDVDRLVVCDACQSRPLPIGTLHQWEWPAVEIGTLRFAGSHDLSLPAVLTLADRLGIMPRKVVVLGVEAGRIEPGETMSPELKAALPTIVKRIRGVLESA